MVVQSVEGADVKHIIDPEWADWYRARVFWTHWVNGLRDRPIGVGTK